MQPEGQDPGEKKVEEDILS